MKNIIVAYDQNSGIGASSDLLWLRNLPADLRHFKKMTNGTAIIMGRKTFNSIGHALPGRQNIVISRFPIEIEGVTTVASLARAYEVADPGKEIFVIGGGQIYRLALDTVERIYATEVGATFAADVFFPAIDPAVWREISRVHHDADEQNLYDYDFVIYQRR